MTMAIIAIIAIIFIIVIFAMMGYTLMILLD
jgi:hypothetical protein